MRSDAFSLLEETTHLLRRTGFSALACHWSGSIPFAIALLVCWNSITSGPVSDARCAGGAFVLAVLLIWMNCRRAVFAGRLLRQLSGSPEMPWTSARIWGFVSLQAFLAATKPFILVVSLLILFPFARAVAFYRTAAALADRAPDSRLLIRQARRIAALDFGQTWKLIPLLLLLLIAVAGNLALTVAALPQLVRVLTGYESVFSRSGQYFFENPLFFVFVLVLAWLFFDPFVQAVYCVRCFHGESRETGEDVRAGLRLIRAAAVALLVICCARASTAVSPGDLEQSVHRTMQAPVYSWRIPPSAKSNSGTTPWIVTVTDRMINALRNGFKELGKLIMKVIDWIFDRLGVQPTQQGGALPSAGLHWSLYLLMAIILIVLAWAIYRKRLFQRRRGEATPAAAIPLVRLEEEGLTADRLPEDSWLELAAQCLREEQFRLALRAFFLANLAWLGSAGFLAIHAGKTNREFEMELRRRAQIYPEARELFAANITCFERAWYGRYDATREDVEQLRDRAQAMKPILAPPRNEAAA